MSKKCSSWRARLAPLDVIIDERVDPPSFELLENVTKKFFANICPVEAWKDIMYPVARQRRRIKSHEKDPTLKSSLSCVKKTSCIDEKGDFYANL